MSFVPQGSVMRTTCNGMFMSIPMNPPRKNTAGQIRSVANEVAVAHGPVYGPSRSNDTG